MKNGKLIFDLVIVVLSLFVFAFLILFFKLGLFVSILLYLLTPSLYLIYRKKKDLWRIIYASLILGVLLGMSYDFLSEHYLAYITNYEFNFLNYKIIGDTPFGDFVWAFLIPFSIIIFYEHFLDFHKKLKVNTKAFKLSAVSLVIFFFTAIHIAFFTEMYKGGLCVYFVVGAISCSPIIMLFFEKFELSVKILLCNLYFLLLNAIFEFTALTLNHWSYPGDYIAKYSFGHAVLPIEEIIFWIVPSSIVFVIFWEYFFDDFK